MGVAQGVGKLVLGAGHELASDDLPGQQELERLGKAGLALAVGRPDGGKQRAERERLSLPAESPEALNLNLVDLRTCHGCASVHQDGLRRPSPRRRRMSPRLAPRRRSRVSRRGCLWPDARSAARNWSAARRVARHSPPSLACRHWFPRSLACFPALMRLPFWRGACAA